MPDALLSVTNSVYPTKDKENNPLETEYGMCEFEDSQTVTLQEVSARARMRGANGVNDAAISQIALSLLAD